MAYKVDRGIITLYAIIIALFLCFSHNPILLDTTLRKRSDDPLLVLSVNLCHAALSARFLILSIISMAFAVCIPKKIHRISIFLFRAFILESE